VRFCTNNPYKEVTVKFVDSIMAPGITPSWVAKERIEEAKAITIPYQPLPSKEVRDERKEEEK